MSVEQKAGKGNGGDPWLGERLLGMPLPQLRQGGPEMMNGAHITTESEREEA